MRQIYNEPSSWNTETSYVGISNIGQMFNMSTFLKCGSFEPSVREVVLGNE